MRQVGRRGRSVERLQQRRPGVPEHAGKGLRGVGRARLPQQGHAAGGVEQRRLPRRVDDQARVLPREGRGHEQEAAAPECHFVESAGRRDLEPGLGEANVRVEVFEQARRTALG